ncbi:SbcC/MukB-like Walker B domain-containing protein [Caproiciproducens sp. MSJ-32]|uniref:SbcC/MukB-like Walker B domain-containing protein n=1 Tax=Caproiciproducens sp. MSJ-32 TaxID=2841527 RepID=UPI001C101D04|nr:SbcC/MukB-like Walker B domain-containing protein [Caproiciproducens sp. MSJ-32]MBU5453929.1 AAA family ATPase [Caproiciproducens sp. MSJ-32]
MKIKKLVISAFGPYAERQELNFEENLKDKNIFVITGNTGAGKTTIFDAINFALFGEASGSERDGKNLRSDFASPETKTEVELWFSMRNKDYYVKRSPQYYRKKQRGEGFTESKASAELKYKDKIITGYKEVTRGIEEILGINSEQFKQLVMIPQGEFKKLLNSDSDKKEEIFRKIFGTKIFSDIQQNIKNEVNELKRNIELIQRDRENNIKAFIINDENINLKELVAAKDMNIGQIIKAFEEEITFDKEKLLTLKFEIDKIQEKIEILSKELVIINENNKKLEKKDSIKLEFEKLASLKENYKEKALILEKAKKALKLELYEKDYRYKKSLNDEVNFKLIESIKDIEKYLKEYDLAYKRLQEEKSKEEERNNLLTKLNEINKLKEKTLKYEENKLKVNKLKTVLITLEKDINSINMDIRNNSDLVSKLTIELENISSLKSKKNELEIKAVNLNKKTEDLNKLLDSLENYKRESNKHSRLAHIYEEADRTYKNAKNDYESLEEAFRRNQAGILAKNLKEGEPCPVCGSKHHPSPAVLNSQIIDEALVKEAKAKVDNLYENREKYYRDLSKSNANLESNKEEIILPLLVKIFNKKDFEDLYFEINRVSELINENNLELTNIKKEIEKISKFVDTEEEKIKEKKDKEERIEKLRNNLEEKNKELLFYKENLKIEETNLKNIVEEFNGEVKTFNELESIRKETNFKLEELKRNYEKAEIEYNLVKSNLDKENGNKRSLEIRLRETKKELELSIEIFKEKTLALGFKDGRDYKNSQLKESEIEALEKEINNYNNNFTNTEKMLIEITKECEGLVKRDVKELELKIENYKDEKLKLQDNEKKLYSKIEQNTRLLDKIKKNNELIEKDEKKYSTIGRLSKIINGDNNRKISFERYVLASYFEDIITAANLRLSRMSCNRFELLRKEELGDKRKGQGLDLEVFDNYTGKARDVKTLSGGEAFKASLSMALGLADVVQAYSGGIQLDTIFVDEGFGTLDSESLDNAIECLVELQNDGRVVGIISHVQELKDRIDSKIVITSTNKGSRAQFN